MDIQAIFILLILLFFIIYFSVRLAISPLLNMSNEITLENNYSELIHLRDLEILSSAELEEVEKLYKNRTVSKENYEQYKKHLKILSELKDINYLSNEQLDIKINKLKEYYKIN